MEAIQKKMNEPVVKQTPLCDEIDRFPDVCSDY
jgi:hypothetical protein